MSKARIAAAVVAMAMVGLPVMLSASAASAATSSDLSTPSATQAPEFAAADRGEDDGNHQQSKGDDGEKHHGVIPPVVIRPHEDGDNVGDDNVGDDDNGGPIGGGVISGPVPSPSVAPTPGATAGPNPSGAGFGKRDKSYVVAPLNAGQNPPGSTPIGSDVQQIDPQQAPPIEVAGVHASAKTPADLFMESATLGLAAMGIGALAFGGVAGVRAIRLRKEPNDDYFYEAK